MMVIDPENQIAYVLEHTSASRRQVEDCLAIEDEYLYAAGIMTSPGGEPWNFRFYPVDDRVRIAQRPPPVVDGDELARDAERLAGVPYERAVEILAFGTEYIVKRQASVR